MHKEHGRGQAFHLPEGPHININGPVRGLQIKSTSCEQRVFINALVFQVILLKPGFSFRLTQQDMIHSKGLTGKETVHFKLASNKNVVLLQAMGGC